MAEIVNLRQARKAKAKRDAEARAAAKRAQFGRSKPEKAQTKSLCDKSAKDIESHKLDDENG